MEQATIRETIARFPRWHYQFDLKGNLTPVPRPRLLHRHRRRREHILPALTGLFGGSLAGKRVLDLGCNAGFWSLQAVQAGCSFVLGIDGRAMHIAQANFVFEALEVEQDRYRFVEGNLFDTDLSQFGEFDVVLCLGLLYHVSKPMGLMERISAINGDVLVIDTQLSRLPWPLFEVRHEPIEDYVNAVDYTLTMVPTWRAVMDLVREFGYGVVMLKPEFEGSEGVEDYRDGSRRVFLCAKNTALTGLRTPIEAQGLRGQEVRDGRSYLLRGLERIRRRLIG